MKSACEHSDGFHESINLPLSNSFQKYYIEFAMGLPNNPIGHDWQPHIICTTPLITALLLLWR